ncbi:MAG TPA: ParB/RepB/Spo0J family partition protein [Ktedonobacteraceae bacterium]|nr:ParB/RepB/Spo0J family partition protein [Ktedonobacteraceae bacterium]
MPQQRARLSSDLAKHQLGLNVGSPILAEIAGAKGASSPADEQTIEQVPVDLILPNPFQPRRDFDEQGLEELAEVMKSMGFFGALLGRRQQRHIQLAYGERRVRAAKMAGLQEIPMEIRTLSDEDMFNIAVVENEQRRDLTQLEVGEAFVRAQEQFGLSERQIAERLGKSKGYVRNRIETARLPEDLKAVLRTTTEETFSASHARELARVENEITRRVLTDQVKDENLNYQQTKLAVEDVLWRLEHPEDLSSGSASAGEDTAEEVLESLDEPQRQQREQAHGVDRLRLQSERLLHTIEQLVSDPRIDRQELRAALEQIYDSIFNSARDLS